MSFVNVSPELVASAAQNVAGIGSALDQAHAVAASATTSVVAAAGDEVSAAIAAVFSGHGQAFQAASAQAAQFHAQFAQTLGGAEGAYAAAEAASTGQLQLPHIEGTQGRILAYLRSHGQLPPYVQLLWDQLRPDLSSPILQGLRLQNLGGTFHDTLNDLYSKIIEKAGIPPIPVHGLGINENQVSVGFPHSSGSPSPFIL